MTSEDRDATKGEKEKGEKSKGYYKPKYNEYQNMCSFDELET